MASEQTLLLLLQILNTGLGLAKELGVHLGPLAKRLDELDAEGKNLSAEELAEYVKGLRAELDGLEADIEARKAQQGLPLP